MLSILLKTPWNEVRQRRHDVDHGNSYQVFHSDDDDQGLGIGHRRCDLGYMRKYRASWLLPLATYGPCTSTTSDSYHCIGCLDNY